ncbi:hypothetical protein V8G54_037713 [Vigna mungo]|uniref:Uncharacterized protein n=1 Tax=Vigna mungo TaxID=3915 RepID=A0AAQ3MJ36_VIGMU
MNSVQGPVVCPSVRAKQVAPMIGAVKMNLRRIRSEFWGLSGVKVKPGFLSCRINTAKCKTVHCSFNSPSNDSGSAADSTMELRINLCHFLLIQVKLVRVTRRVHEAYFAQLYLTKAFTFYSFLFPPIHK